MQENTLNTRWKQFKWDKPKVNRKLTQNFSSTQTPLYSLEAFDTKAKRKRACLS